MSDVFNNSIQTSTLGERLTTIKNLYIPPGVSQVLSLGFGSEVEPLNISNYGKSLLNVSSLNGLINLINQQDSKMEVLDSGTGHINVVVDNQLVAVWSSGNLTFQPNKILYVDTIMSGAGSVNFFSDVKPVIPTLNFGTNAERWNNVFASTIDTNVLISTGAGNINVNSNLICNGPLYINNGILPYTGGGMPQPQNIGSAGLRFQKIYTTNFDANGLLETEDLTIYGNGNCVNLSATDNISAPIINTVKIQPNGNTNSFMGITSGPYLINVLFQSQGEFAPYTTTNIQSAASGPIACGFANSFYNASYGFNTHVISSAIISNQILPSVDGLYDIGATQSRWNNIFALNATINTSDFNQKRDIKDTDFGLDFLLNLRPVSYRWKKEGSTRIHQGLIAQEVRNVLGSSNENPLNENAMYCHIPAHKKIVKNIDKETGEQLPDTIEEVPEFYALRYNEFIAPIIKSIQELNEKFENNTQVQGDTIVLNSSTPVQQSISTSSSSNLKLQKQVDNIVGRVFNLENKTEEDESESDFSMINSLQTRVHQLEIQNQKYEKKIKSLTTAVNKLLKNM